MAFDNLYSRIPFKYNSSDGTTSYEWEYLVGGYFFFQIYILPQFMNNATDKNLPSKLQALCTRVTLPDITLDHIDKPGLGGLHVTLPTKLTSNNTLDITYTEINPTESERPLVYSLSYWVQNLRDFQTGIATELSNYKGNAVLIATDPAIANIVFAVKFLGIFPVNIPLSSYAADITSNELVEWSTQFALDRTILVGSNDPQASSLLSNAQEWRDNNMLPAL